MRKKIVFAVIALSRVIVEKIILGGDNFSLFCYREECPYEQHMLKHFKLYLVNNINYVLYI